MAALGYPPSTTGSNAMFYDSSTAHDLPPDPQEKASLPRSISMADLSVTARCRGYVKNDWCMNVPHGGTNFFTSTPYFTLTLPPLDEYPPEFKEFAFNRIINRDTQQSLEDEKCLNWCPAATKLVPLYTLGDGNCLLHAASLAMWGFSDRDYILRRAVSHAVTNCNNNTLCQRWKHTKDMDNEQYGIQLEQHQWEAEWGEIVRQASAEAAPGKSLEGLEEFHVFVLANILRRPIIMYAVPKMRSYAGSTLQRVNFHGIYLPLLWDKTACKKDPLPIAFYGGHFSALVVIEFPRQYWNGNLVFPLVDYFGQQLPVRFTLPQEDQTALMMDYLDFVQISSKCSPYIQSSNVICAKLAVQETPAYLKPLLKGFFDACFHSYKANRGYHPQQQPHGNLVTGAIHGGGVTQGGGAVSNTDQRIPCINGCGMFGDAAMAGLCSQCYKEEQKKMLSHHTSPVLSQSQRFSNASSSSPSSSQTLKCVTCSNPAGSPQYLGMCEACYQKQQSQPRSVSSQQQQNFPEPIYEPLHPVASSQATVVPPAVPPPRSGSNPGERPKCRMVGCEFFGTAETRYYCSKCFDENYETIFGEVGTPHTAPQPLGYRPDQSLPHIQQRSASVSGAGSVKKLEPGTCTSCQEYHGSDEFGGICWKCFQAISKYESSGIKYEANPLGGPPVPTSTMNPPAPPHVQRPAPQRSQHRCASQNCPNFTDTGGFCANCNMTQSLPGPATNFSSTPPPPPPRAPVHRPSDQQQYPNQGQEAYAPQTTARPYTDVRQVDQIPADLSGRANTAPVVGDIASQMQGMNISTSDRDHCCLCQNQLQPGRHQYFICAQHAAFLRQLIPSGVNAPPAAAPAAVNTASGMQNAPTPIQHQQFQQQPQQQPQQPQPVPKPRKRPPVPKQPSVEPMSDPFQPVYTKPGPNYGQPLPGSTDANRPDGGTPGLQNGGGRRGVGGGDSYHRDSPTVNPLVYSPRDSQAELNNLSPGRGISSYGQQGASGPELAKQPPFRQQEPQQFQQDPQQYHQREPQQLQQDPQQYHQREHQQFQQDPQQFRQQEPQQFQQREHQQFQQDPQQFRQQEPQQFQQREHQQFRQQKPLRAQPDQQLGPGRSVQRGHDGQYYPEDRQQPPPMAPYDGARREGDPYMGGGGREGEQYGGGGARGGAEGGAVGGGSEEEATRKKLCRTPGCSFKPAEQLGGLCPDCYDEAYKKK